VQRRGVRVSVVSTIRTQPPMIADELRRQADHFIELQTLMPTIYRDHPNRERGNAGSGRDTAEPADGYAEID
jgi:uncharacterized LabA/DUF88 family protein